MALEDRRTELREEVRAQARNEPGVYRFTGPRGEILYVGKSVRLRSRLLSWFRSAPRSKGWELLRVTHGIDWDHVPTEFEALVREFRLIRAARPRYNVRHRRERRFAWVRVTRERAPRLVATRSPRADGSLLFGPFPAGRDLPRTLERLAYLQGIRDCRPSTPMRFSDQLELLSSPLDPLCIRGETGSCPAPCAGGCTEATYSGVVLETVRFLKGESDAPLERLRDRLAEAATRREYEAAARLRDTESELRILRDSIRDFPRRLAELTGIYRIPTGSGGMRGYLLARGRVRLSFDEPVPGSASAGRLARRIADLLAIPPAPPHALSESEREEAFLVAQWFGERPEEQERIVSPDAWALSAGTARPAGCPSSPRPSLTADER